MISNILKKHNKIFIYLLGAFLTKGIAYLTTPIFTRIMSADDFGILSLLTTWTTILSLFVAAQISGTVPSIFVKYKENTDDYIGRALILSLLSFIVFFVVALIFQKPLVSVMQLQNSYLVPCIVFLGYGKAISNLYVSYTVQKKQAKRNVLFSSLVAFFALIVGVSFALTFQQNRYIGKTMGEMLIYLIVIAFVFRTFKINKSRIDIAFFKEELVLSIPLIFHLLSTNIISQSDKIFISNMINMKATAIYSVAHTIGMLALVVVEAVFNVWIPWFFGQLEMTDRKDLINKMFLLCVVAVSGVYGLVILFSREFFLLMAPSSYQGGITCTVIISFSTFFSFLYRFPLCFEQYKREMRWVAVATCIASLCNLILNYLMIPIWGINGAAIATLISTIVLWMVHEIVARRKIKNYPIQMKYYVVGIIAVIPAIILLIINPYNFIYRITAAIIYLLIIVLLCWKISISKLVKN